MSEIGDFARIGRLLLKSPPDVDEVRGYSQKQLSKYLLAILIFKHLVALRAEDHLHQDDNKLVDADGFGAFLGILLATKCGEDLEKTEKTLDLVQDLARKKLEAEHLV